MRIKALIVVAALVVASPAWAIYKCTKADGRVALQDAPCDNSAKTSEQIKVRSGTNVMESGRGTRIAVEPNTALKGPAEAAALLTLYRRWADAERLAFTTSRIALATPIATLQAIKREAESLTVPSCLTQAKEAINTLISKSNDAILQFAGKEELTAVAYTTVERPKLIPRFEREVEGAKCTSAQAAK
ncbi:hypothetical protein [Ottowia sp. VDI28]|uniref:hypothetical protein n=1 Tax=Ottowia sp. VDI28 TaxID=3133968 RepID=UPI003C30923D